MKLKQTLVFTFSFISNFIIGVLSGFFLMPIFIFLGYIFISLFTTYRSMDIDPMPIGFWSIILWAIIFATVCSILILKIYRRRYINSIAT